MNKKKNIWFYIFILIFPLFLWVDFKCYFEFILISLFIKYSTSFLLKRFLSNNKIFLIKDIIQILYSALILFFYLYTLTPEKTIDGSKLIGDSLSYYQDTLSFQDVGEEKLSIIDLRNYVGNNYFFYQIVLSKLFLIFEHNLMAGFLFSAFIGILNFVLLNIIINKITSNNKINYYFSILYLISPHIIAASTYLYKDNLVVLSFIIILYGAINYVLNPSRLIKSILIIIGGLVLTFAVRLPYIYIYVALTLLLIIYCRQNFIISIRSILFFVLTILSVFILYNNSNYSTVAVSGESILYDYDYHRSRLTEDMTLYGSGITSALVGDYSTSSITHQIIYLPVVCFVQYVTPINIFSFDYDNPWYFIDINCKFIWLFITGPLLIFTFLNFKFHNKLNKMLILMSVLGFAIIAHIQTGIVPRYALPFTVVALIPCAFNYALTKHYLIRPKYKTFQFCYFVPFISFYLIYLLRPLI